MFNVITNEPNVISNKLSECDDFVINNKPIKCEVNYWLNINQYYEYYIRKQLNGINVVLFNPTDSWKEKVHSIEHCIFQNKTYYYNKKCSCIKNRYYIELASDFKKKLKIGIACIMREYKGTKILSELFDNYDISDFKFVIAGDRWINFLNRYMSKHDIKYVGKLKHSDMPKFYEQIDYLLIPTDEEHGEGGPLVFIEAMSMKVPIITSRVGYAYQYPCQIFSSAAGLYDILTINNRKVAVNSWNDFIKNHINIFNYIIGENNGSV